MLLTDRHCFVTIIIIVTLGFNLLDLFSTDQVILDPFILDLVFPGNPLYIEYPEVTSPVVNEINPNPF